MTALQHVQFSKSNSFRQQLMLSVWQHYDLLLITKFWRLLQHFYYVYYRFYAVIIYWRIKQLICETWTLRLDLLTSFSWSFWHDRNPIHDDKTTKPSPWQQSDLHPLMKKWCWKLWKKLISGPWCSFFHLQGTKRGLILFSQIIHQVNDEM